MPGFETDIGYTEIVGNEVHVIAYVNWFLHDINIVTSCIFPYTCEYKVKEVDGVSSAVRHYKIKYDDISASCRWTLGQDITMSIKKKTENDINTK